MRFSWHSTAEKTCKASDIVLCQDKSWWWYQATCKLWGQVSISMMISWYHSFILQLVLQPNHWWLSSQQGLRCWSQYSELVWVWKREVWRVVWLFLVFLFEGFQRKILVLDGMIGDRIESNTCISDWVSGGGGKECMDRKVVGFLVVVRRIVVTSHCLG